MKRLAKLLTVGMLALASGCEGDGDDSSTTTADASIPADVTDRSCRTQIRTEPLRRGPKALTIGPVTWQAARPVGHTGDQALIAAKDRPPGAWFGFKLVTSVEPDTEATVIVPKKDRDSLRLLYDREAEAISNSAYYRPSEATAAVKFRGCPEPPEGGGRAFNGGILARRPGCFELTVLGDGTQVDRGTMAVAVADSDCE